MRPMFATDLQSIQRGAAQFMVSVTTATDLQSLQRDAAQFMVSVTTATDLPWCGMMYCNNQ
jgi:hypothetical protein